MSEPNHRRRPESAFARRRSLAGTVTLIIGWVLSCALVTGVTLTAVGRVGHEISGNQPQVITEQQVIGKLNQSATPITSPSAAFSSDTAPAASTSKPTTSPSSGAPLKSPSTSPSPTGPHPTPSVTPSVAPTQSPSPTPKPDKAASPSQQPVTSAPAGSSIPSTATGNPSTSPSVSASPVASPVTHKTTAYVPGGSITVLCVGNSIYQAAVTISDSKYTLNTKSTNNPKVDVIFTTGTTSTEYIYTCAAGQLVGGPVSPEHTG